MRGRCFTKPGSSGPESGRTVQICAATLLAAVDGDAAIGALRIAE